MRSRDALEVLSITDPRTITRLRDRAGLAAPIGSGTPHRWSPGDVLAMYIVHEFDGASDGRESKWAEGARKCGEALDNGYRPAFLVTRGHTENLVVIETEHPDQTDEMVKDLLMQASDAGAAVKVLRLREVVAALEPWLSELIDA